MRASSLRLLLPLLCSSPALASKPPQPTVAALELSPPRVSLVGRGAEDRVHVTAILADGTRRDVTARVVLSGGGPSVGLGPEGRLRGVRDGQATVGVSFGGRKALLPVSVSRSGMEQPVSFRYDVLPILSRAGCNQGACHGNAEGKGGFRLSLKGEDPEGDYEVIARRGSRRLNRIDPGASLLLLKATGTLPHGGGERFRTGSEEYRALASWLAAGAGFDPPGSPRLVRLEVIPKERVLTERAWLQRLSVLGRFSDGTVRNLARRAVFSPGDPALQASPDGTITTGGPVDAAVLVRCADQMETARLTFVPARKGFAWNPPPAHNWIDSLQFRRLKVLRLQPSALASDTEFLRRAYLDALGVLPTPDEVRAFLKECETERRGPRENGLTAEDAENAERNRKRVPLNRPRRSIPLASASSASSAVSLSPVRVRLNARAKLIESLLARPEFDDFWTLKWPRQNIMGGSRYLQVLARRYCRTPARGAAGVVCAPEELVRVIAGYHAGPGAVDKYGGMPPYETTRAYVQSVLTRYEEFRHKEGASAAAGTVAVTTGKP